MPAGAGVPGDVPQRAASSGEGAHLGSDPLCPQAEHDVHTSKCSHSPKDEFLLPVKLQSPPFEKWASFVTLTLVAGSSLLSFLFSTGLNDVFSLFFFPHQ